jgi:hypothetical protein
MSATAGKANAHGEDPQRHRHPVLPVAAVTSRGWGELPFASGALDSY